MLPRHLVAVLPCLLAAGPLTAQQRVETESEIIEFYGLKRWTTAMIRDSLSAKIPGWRLDGRLCATELREVLGFPQASVAVYGGERGPKRYVEVTVVEPADAAAAAFNPPLADSLPDREEWQDVIAPYRRNRSAFLSILNDHRLLLADSIAHDYLQVRPLGTRIREFVQLHQQAHDRYLAERTLASDANPANRIAAMLILAGDASRDSTWWRLAEVLNDRDVGVGTSFAAGLLLQAMARERERPVNWGPVVPALRRALAGTAAWVTPMLMETLRRTSEDRCLAVQLFRGNVDTQLAKLASGNRHVREAVHAFLVALGGGTDLGYDPGAWRRWLERAGCGPLAVREGPTRTRGEQLSAPETDA